MKKSKKTLSFLMAVLLFVSMCFVGGVMNVNAKSMRDVTAYDLISEIKIGVNIGNSLDSVGNSETSWGNPKITKELIRKYKELGFDTIRLPVTWRTHIDASGFPESAWLDRVQEVVDWILEEDLKCILNTHHEQNWLNTNSSGMTMRKTKFANLWTDIATRFKYYDENLMFEAFNEILKKESDWSPADEIDYQNANELAQVFVDTVRATGNNNEKRILIINTYGAIREVYGFAMPTDVVPYKLAVQFHAYDPQGFCFAGSKSTWSNSDGSIIDSYCRLFYESFVSKGVPVILGEFGAVDKSNEYDRAQYAEVVAKNCVKYGIKPVWWDDGGDFRLISRQNYSVLFPQIVSALIDNSAFGIMPAATTYTNPNANTTYKTMPPTTTTLKTTTTTTIPDIKMSIVQDVKYYIYNDIELSVYWTKISDADYYKIYKSTEGGEFECIGTSRSNMYSDLSFDAFKNCKYVVVACREYAGLVFESEFSESYVVSYDYEIETTTTSSTTQPTTKPTTTVATQPTTKPTISTTQLPTLCRHTSFELENTKPASYFNEGYSGDKFCADCGGLLEQGNTIAKYILKVPSFKVVSGKKQFKVKYTKVPGATGLQVRYKLKGKWLTKTFTAKKNVTKTIKKLKKGTYQVKIRAILKQGNKFAYSKWSKVRKVKVK